MGDVEQGCGVCNELKDWCWPIDIELALKPMEMSELFCPFSSYTE